VDILQLDADQREAARIDRRGEKVFADRRAVDQQPMKSRR
jgi:hypothetical protein